jgi:flagellin
MRVYSAHQGCSHDPVLHREEIQGSHHQVLWYLGRSHGHKPTARKFFPFAFKGGINQRRSTQGWAGGRRRSENVKENVLMSLVLNTNVTSLIAQRRLDVSSTGLRASMERLASGYRINRAADDAAGLTISQGLVSQMRRMKQALRNTEDGISVLQVAEGALTVIGENLQRVRELTIQAANDTYNTNLRNAITNEIQSLLNDTDRIANAANFNGINLLDGSVGVTAPPALLQIGPNSNTITNTVDISSVMVDSRATGIGVVGGGVSTFSSIATISFATGSASARNFLTDVDSALRNLNSQRANIGSYQTKLESVSANLTMSIENFANSNSRIRDIDIASESANMVQNQILSQAATSILSQANQLPQMVLKLLDR